MAASSRARRLYRASPRRLLPPLVGEREPRAGCHPACPAQDAPLRARTMCHDPNSRAAHGHARRDTCAEPERIRPSGYRRRVRDGPLAHLKGTRPHLRWRWHREERHV